MRGVGDDGGERKLRGKPPALRSLALLPYRVRRTEYGVHRWPRYDSFQTLLHEAEGACD